MSEEQQGCITVSSQPSDVRPYTSIEGPVIANSGTTANDESDISNNGTKSTGGSAKDSCGSKTSTAGPVKDSSDITVTVDSAASSSYTTDNNGSATDSTGTMANGNSLKVNRCTTANGGLATVCSGTATNGDSKKINVESETGGSIFSNSKTSISCRTRYKRKDLEVLEQEFLLDPKPTFNKRLEIAKSIQKKEQQVNSWFQRRRRKQRKERVIPKQFWRKLRYQRCKSPWFNLRPQSVASSQQSNVLLEDRQSINTSHLPVLGQEIDHRLKDQPFVQTNKDIVNDHGYGIPQQQQRSDCNPGGTHRHHFLAKSNQSANKRKPASEQDVNFKFRDQSFVPNYYREVNGIGYEVPGQLPLLEGLHNGKACIRSQVNQGPSTNRKDQVQGQEIVVRDRPFVPNYYREVNSASYVVPTQHSIHVAPQATRDFYHVPFIQGPTANTQGAVKQDKVKFIVSDQPFVPNYYRELSGVGDVSLMTHPLPEGQHAGIDYRSLLNTGLGTSRCNLGQEIKIEEALQKHAHDSRIRPLEPAVMLPYWYQDPYCTHFPIPLYRIACGIRKYLHPSF